MRRSYTLISLALLAGCSPAPELDSGTDAGTDGGPDARDAAELPDAPPPLEYTLVHGPAWDEPCAPWDIEPYTLDRALPADPSVRQLWRWDPTEDPELFEFNAAVSAPAIGRDGDLYVRFGVENQRLARLDRDGAVIWTRDLGVQIWEPPTILPDGDLVVVLTSTSAFLDPTIPRTVLRLSSSGATEASWSLSGRHRTQVSVGPGGRVYLVNGADIHATCRAERIAWTLHVSDPRFWWGYSYVESDGSLHVSPDYEYQVPPRRLSERGEYLEHPWPLPADLLERPAQIFNRRGPLVIGVVATGWSTFETYLLVQPETTWRRLADDGPTPGLTAVLDPAGGVWTYSSARTLTRYLDDRLLHVRTRGADCDRREGWYEDGSLLCFHSGSAHGAIRVSAETGENLWQIFPTTPGGLAADPAEIAVDRTGRLYVSTFAGLFAFQTDALPAAEEDGCAMPYRGCNERRDGAAVRWDR